MIGRREAIGLGAAVTLGLLAVAEACTIMPLTKKQIKKGRITGIKAVKQLISALAERNRKQILSVMGSGPWRFHGERIERTGDPEAIVTLAKNLVPGGYVRSLSDIAHLDGKTFASVEIWDPSEADDDCFGGDRLAFLAFDVLRSGEIYSVDMVNG